MAEEDFKIPEKDPDGNSWEGMEKLQRCIPTNFQFDKYNNPIVNEFSDYVKYMNEQRQKRIIKDID